MAYSPTTRIGNKSSDHSSLGHADLLYGYDNSGLTHQPRVIYDANSTQCVQLYWDRNGNLRQIQSDKDDARFHLWDDDNQLLMSVGPTTCGYYGNASDGKRAYKLDGIFSQISMNGGVIDGYALFDNTTLYPNPYMTLTKDGYTKHYFMGADRIGTTIGGGNNGNWLVDPVDALEPYEEQRLFDLGDGSIYGLHYYDVYDYPGQNDHTENTDYTGTIEYGDAGYSKYQYQKDEFQLKPLWIDFKDELFEHYLYEYFQNDKTDEPYYYHSDHLGSAAWITDGQGLPVQYIMYAPYGEELLNQQPFSYNERFTFTSKERDAETGYDYFGARYRESNFLNHFISVDPLADKFIDKTPYLYCDGNPIKYVDPDGKEKHVFLNPIEDLNKFMGALNYSDNIPTIHIWAHGSPHSMYFYNTTSNIEYKANSAEKVLKYLQNNVFKNSDAWAKHESDGTQAVIVLHSCKTGKGDNSIAQQLSELLPNTVIIAPTENVAVNPKTQTEEGVYKTKPSKNYSKNNPTYTKESVGAWVMFRNGEKIGSFNGTTKPNVSNPANFHNNDNE